MKDWARHKGDGKFKKQPSFLIAMEYDLELDKAIEKIKQEDVKTVCLQLPDGLKPMAEDIQNEIESQTDAKVIIWAGSNFGSCDFPTEAKQLGVDLLIAWGHSEWRW